jgi:hypothetical protein
MKCPDCDPAAWEAKDVGPKMMMADVTASSVLGIASSSDLARTIPTVHLSIATELFH